MAHPLVDQLRFARSEFVRGLAEVADPQAQQRFGNLNCISWIVGHLAWQEQRYWLYRAQGQVLVPELNEMLAYGKPACTPPVQEMWAAWRQVIEAADPWLDTLTVETMQAPLMEGFSSAGTFMYRTIYHYWYHLGEGMAIRQLLGHTGLPDFVGDIDNRAPYRAESGGEAAHRVSKDEFLAQVRRARGKWDSLLAGIDDELMVQPGASGEWTIKDIVAHITWHEREMVDMLRSRRLAGSDLWQIPMEERNGVIYRMFKELPLAQVRAEAAETYRRLLEELEKLSDEDLHDASRFAEMPPDWRPVEVLASNTYQHYLDHHLALQVWLKRLAADPGS